MKKRALISVYDKTQITPFANQLNDLGFEIISTGGTAQLLRESGVPVRNVSDITGFPEMLDGRVKTLHPLIHGGILANRNKESHMSDMKKLNVGTIDIVVVNLYPFKETVSRKDATMTDAIENIDIGGPTLLRAAAKNFEFVLPICDPSDYDWIISELITNGSVSFQKRLKLARKAFEHTAKYDAVIAEYFSKISQSDEILPQTIVLCLNKEKDLRYGENPHQKAALYREVEETYAKIEQLNGKELSFNNINDIDAAISIIREFTEPCAVAVKHTNPCGVACGKDIKDAFLKAYKADPVSIFGGIVALNQCVNEETAEELTKIFLEVIIAPDYTKKGLEILSKKRNLRILKSDFSACARSLDIRVTQSGILVQQPDLEDYSSLTVVTQREPTVEEMKDLEFAWKVVKHAKSNAIVLAKDLVTLGIGAGQANRIWPTEHCVSVAGKNAKGSVLASDGFLPFPDVVQKAAQAGVTAVIQPGGSIRDAESIKAADENGIAMVFTNYRHFKH